MHKPSFARSLSELLLIAFLLTSTGIQNVHAEEAVLDTTPTTETQTVVDEPIRTEPEVDDGEEDALEEARDFTDIVRQTTNFTCGPAALATLITLKGGSAEEMEVADLAGTTQEDGTTLLGLKKAAEQLGYKATVKKWSASRLSSASLPVLIHDKKEDETEHYSVVQSFSENEVEIADTIAGNITMDLVDFNTFYSGKALVIEPLQKVTSNMSVDAALNVLAANPELAATIIDENGKKITLEQLEDLADDEAAATKGKFAQVLAIPLGAAIGPEIIGFAVTGTAIVVGGVISFSDAFTAWLYRTSSIVKRAVDRAISATTPAPQEPGGCGPNGGTYKLLDAAKNVVYIGRTDDLSRRKLEHAKNPEKSSYKFEVDSKTNDCDAQRGREQQLWDKYKPSQNKIRPISLGNPNLQKYLDAATRILGKLK